MRLILASSNRHKLAEFRRLLGAAAPRVELVSAADAGVHIGFEEGSDDYHTNAIGKARSVSLATGQAVIADDSGIEVDALGGAPGVLSARYGPAHADDAGRAAYLLQQVAAAGAVPRAARFVCCVALFVAPRRFVCVQATVDGTLANRPAGAGGFGYDPVFVPESANCTMAELTQEQKDAVSHRGRALRACVRCLDSQLGQLLT